MFKWMKDKLFEDAIGYRSENNGVFFIKYTDLNAEIMMLIINKYNEIQKKLNQLKL